MIPFGSLDNMGGGDGQQSTAYLLQEGDQTFGQQQLTTMQKREEQTKSMKKYEKELQFKNRVLREKEKAVFNQGVLKKLSSNKISTNDLKSERTLTNYRQSKKHLATVNSSGSFINEDVYSLMHQEMHGHDLKHMAAAGHQRKRNNNDDLG